MTTVFHILTDLRLPGNVFIRVSAIEDPALTQISGDGVEKVVFMVLFQGEQLKNRLGPVLDWS